LAGRQKSEQTKQETNAPRDLSFEPHHSPPITIEV
jgi:hypothetical protein